MGANSSFPDRHTPGGEGLRPPGGGRYSHTGLSPDGETPPYVRDKKKKGSKLATLRKKLSRARRHSRSFDHAKAIRELTASWTIRELNALVEEYEASIVLKELAILANLARPHANTIKEDLSHLYDFKYCTDVDLIYQGTVFPIHRAILSARCPYFRDLLSHFPEYGSQVPVHIRTPGIDVHMFSSLLRYLYTGEFLTHEARLNNVDVIQSLCHEFGTPNPLEQDLRTLLESSQYSDTVLLFASDLHCHEPVTPEDEECAASAKACSNPYAKHELKCHKAILAARSPFFRNLLLRRARSGEELTERALKSPSCIVLDESVIPKQYARVLLHALYLDCVDLSNIVHSSSSTCSLSEVQAMVAGKAHITHVDEAMEIYQIGQFLDLPVLAQGNYMWLMSFFSERGGYCH
jgi:BTB/POZ domain-containing protein 7